MNDIECVQADVEHWLEWAVIGLNLCPFAKSVHAKGQIRYAVSTATNPDGLMAELRKEAVLLRDSDPETHDTTLLIASECFSDFLEFNDFLGEAEAALDDLECAGELQIASFHPRYQFGGTRADDITNCTNRAPYPILHLLREASVERAVEAFPNAEAIYGNNMRTLERLGHAGWAALRRNDAPPSGSVANARWPGR